MKLTKIDNTYILEYSDDKNWDSFDSIKKLFRFWKENCLKIEELEFCLTQFVKHDHNYAEFGYYGFFIFSKGSKNESNSIDKDDNTIQRDVWH